MPVLSILYRYYLHRIPCTTTSQSQPPSHTLRRRILLLPLLCFPLACIGHHFHLTFSRVVDLRCKGFFVIFLLLHGRKRGRSPRTLVVTKSLCTKKKSYATYCPVNLKPCLSVANLGVASERRLGRHGLRSRRCRVVRRGRAVSPRNRIVSTKPSAVESAPRVGVSCRTHLELRHELGTAEAGNTVSSRLGSSRKVRLHQRRTDPQCAAVYWDT